MIRTAIAALALAAALALPAAAQQSAAPEARMIGPIVGSQAPDATVVIPGGETVPLASLAGENGMAVVFVRSLDWCPYCKKQAMDLEAAAAPLAEAGWTLVLLSYDGPETLAGFAEEKDLSYALVSDEDSEAIKAFGLLNEEHEQGSRAYGIPHPAIVFVRANGTVGAVLRETCYKDRPAVEVVTETASLLNEAAGS